MADFAPTLVYIDYRWAGDSGINCHFTGIILIFVGLLILNGYIMLFLNDFVVPIMFKHRLSAMCAWSKFFGLAVRNMGSFTIYGLFVFLLSLMYLQPKMIFKTKNKQQK